MAKPPLSRIRVTFQRELAYQQQLVNQAKGYLVPKARAHRLLTMKEHASIAELAYLKVFLAWERFLEQSFLYYMCGHKEPKIKCHCFVVAPNLDHASVLVYPEGRHYAEWGNPVRVRDRAKRFFKEGEPYWSALGAAFDKLEEMRKIRNCIAHPSKYAREQFEKVVRASLGHVPKRISPGDFLLRNIRGPSNRFEIYICTISIISGKIIT